MRAITYKRVCKRSIFTTSLVILLLFLPLTDYHKGDNYTQNLPTASFGISEVIANPIKTTDSLLDILSKSNNNKEIITTANLKPKPTISAEIASAEYVEPVYVAPIVQYIPKPIVKTQFVAEYASYNHFPYGQCTWWVANHRNIPWFGNARDWYYEASVSGFGVGYNPQVGSIMVSQESNYLGHVSLVTAVINNNTWVVSEMNALYGWGAVDTRTITRGSVYIYGFIY